jgi:signal transduction histidine kinase
MFLRQDKSGGISSPASDFGWKSGIRLATYYTLLLGGLMGAIFFVAYHAIASTAESAELKMVRNHALEYRAWYLSGELEKLERRMSEQFVQEGDVLFVRIKGPDFDYVNFNSQETTMPPVAAIHDLDPETNGADVALGRRNWAIASIPLGPEGFTIQAGKNSRSLDGALSDFRKVFLLTAIPGCLLSVLGGTFLTYRTLSPIRRLIQVMERILESGELGGRAVPERGRNELNALVDLFNRLLGRNEKLIQGMRDSLDHVAHDLRTPVSRLRMTSGRALEEERNEEQLREALADCVEESGYIEELLTILMNVAEAKAGAMKLFRERFRLRSLLEDVVELYEFVGEEKGIRIKVSCPEELFVEGDRTRLAQAMANLVDNAIKYSDSNSAIEVLGKEGDGHVLIEVRDEGIGISGKDLPHVWKRLYRADPSRMRAGMGLGLSLVKAIVEAHGGTVSVKSETGKGSVFAIRIPLN